MTSRKIANAVRLIELARSISVIRGDHKPIGTISKRSLRTWVNLRLYAGHSEKMGIESDGAILARAGLHLGCLEAVVTEGRVVTSGFSIAYCADDNPQGAYDLLGAWPSLPAAFESKRPIVFTRSEFIGGKLIRRHCPTWDPFFVEALGVLDRYLINPSNYEEILKHSSLDGQLDPKAMLFNMSGRLCPLVVTLRHLMAEQTRVPWFVAR